jgi:hypothetical protein
MAYRAKNNAFSTLASSLTNVATTLIVQTGHGDRFPVITAPDETYLTLEDAGGNREIVKVTARVAAADSLTVERAQEGTTALAWAAGAVVELRMTAGLLEEVINDIDDHKANPTDAHDASAISSVPSGNLAATNVQAALNELDTDKEVSINASSAKATPVDADVLGILDSALSFVMKKITLANLKLFLFGSPNLTGVPTAPTAAAGTNTTQIANCAFVIANAPQAFDSGTRMSFNQTAAPTGWTKDTTAALNDSIMRIVTGAVGSGGSNAFSTFNGQSSVGATTLSISQMPAHSHVQNAHNHSDYYQNTNIGYTTADNPGNAPTVGNLNYATSNSESGASTTTGAATATNQNEGGGGSHTHTITTAIKYNDFIIASKN